MYESNGLMSVESPKLAKYSPFEGIFNGHITAIVRCETRDPLCIAVLSNLPQQNNVQ